MVEAALQKNMTGWRMFYKIASLLYDFLPKRKNGSTKEMNMLAQLYPNAARSSLRRDYGIGKMQKVLTIFFIGSITAVILWIGGGSKELLVNNGYVLRDGQGGDEKKVLLTAKRENGEKVDTEMIVRERRFSDRDLEKLYENMLQEVEKTALGENRAWDNIDKELCFMQQIKGYPFTLSWESSDYRYVTNSGRIAQWQEVKEMEAPYGLVSITLRAEYYDFVREHIFFAKICPVENETFAEKAKNALKQSEMENPYHDKVMLPKAIAGENVIWTERTENAGKNIFLLTLAGMAAAWILYDRDLQKKTTHRKKQLAEAYPAVISKLSLYLGAGMNLKGAWEKVAGEGIKNLPVNPLYEEMLFTCHEMAGGVSEAEAYERFGKRMRQQRYIRLTTLMVQNLRKGNAALLFQLRQEAFFAMEERSAEIKRTGEEMGTKLLFPMLLMMGIIMVMIMVPAFLSF